MFQRLRDRGQVREDVRRVGHAQPQHARAVFGKLFDEVPKQTRDVGAEVDAVRARVLRAEPNLRHALRDRRRDARG